MTNFQDIKKSKEITIKGVNEYQAVITFVACNYKEIVWHSNNTEKKLLKELYTRSNVTLNQGNKTVLDGYDIGKKDNGYVINNTTVAGELLAPVYQAFQELKAEIDKEASELPLAESKEKTVVSKNANKICPKCGGYCEGECA